MPLNSIHPNAQIAAEATECAGLQDKFWEMHDMIFNSQSEWSTSPDALSILKGYANQLKLKDPAAFASCMDGHETKAKVEADANFAASVGIGGTPFFVINKAGNTLIQQGSLGVLNGAQPYEGFQQTMDELLQNP